MIFCSMSTYKCLMTISGKLEYANKIFRPSLMHLKSCSKSTDMSVNHAVGAFTYWGNDPVHDISMCYQSAVIPVDVPRMISGSRIKMQLSTRWSLSTKLT